VNCTGYAEPRVALETQAWWTKPGNAIEGMSQHIHLSTCFPLDQTLSGIVPFDIHVQLHDNPDVLNQVVVYVFGNNVSVPQTAATPSYACPTVQCDLWYHIDYDTTKVAADGSLEFRFQARTMAANGSLGYTSTGWQARLANGGGRPVQTYRAPTFIEARGWYTTAEYQNVRLTSPLPSGPVSGLWTFGVKLAPGSGGKPTTHVLVSLDPHFHAVPVDRGRVVFEQNGPYTGSITIDTRTLSNGVHRLFMRTDSTIATGTDSGILAYNFRVDNGAISTLGTLVPLLQTTVAQTGLSLLPWLALIVFVALLMPRRSARRRRLASDLIPGSSSDTIERGDPIPMAGFDGTAYGAGRMPTLGFGLRLVRLGRAVVVPLWLAILPSAIALVVLTLIRPARRRRRP
jgi:hypothetical protein